MLSVKPDQAFHQKVMKSVIGKIQDTTSYVLKGGTALLFTRNLDRHSTDLGFDSDRKVDLEKRIKVGMKDAGVEITALNKVKDTDTVQRFKVHYENPETGKDELLKIETSFRKAPEPELVETVNGIRTYKAAEIFDQKMTAAENRTSPRDIYDIAHLIKEIGDKLSPKQLKRVDEFSQDMDGLDQRYSTAFKDDPVLNGHTTAEETIVKMRDNVEKEQSRRLDLVRDTSVSAVDKIKDPERKEKAQKLTAEITQSVAKIKTIRNQEVVAGKAPKQQGKKIDRDFER